MAEPAVPMSDELVAARLRAVVGDLNHWLHVAQHRGLFVQLTTTQGPGPVLFAIGNVADDLTRISDVYVARPLPPEAPNA